MSGWRAWLAVGCQSMR